MPAPTPQQINANLTNRLIQAGYYYRTYDDNGNIVEDRNKLMPEMERLMNTIAEGISDTWTQWQAATTVTGTAAGVTTGPSASTVTGRLI